MAKIRHYNAEEWSVLDAGWRMLSLPSASELHAISDDTDWLPASVPGTVAASRRLAGCWNEAHDLHAQDHWYRLDTTLAPHAELLFDGLASLTEIWIDGELSASSNSMFEPLSVTVPSRGASRLEICFRALRPLLSGRGAMPRPRWRGHLANTEALSRFRTTLFGHMPDWDGGVSVIGPFRPIRVRQHRPVGPLIEHADLCVEVMGSTGKITVGLRGRALAGCAAAMSAGGLSVSLQFDNNLLTGVLQIPEVPFWWPHTHGTPALFPVTLKLDGHQVDLGRVGFRTIQRREGDGFGLVVNGVPIFCRGALWTGIDSFLVEPERAALLPALMRARDAGMNMLRVPGFGLYASHEFLDICDELGILVWHDFMFSRFDYPANEVFLDRARVEARAFLDATQTSPALAVLCGGLEATQAAAMAGRPPADWVSPLFDGVLADAAAEFRPDIPYVPNAPHGGALPFAASAPVAHYFGVGGYFRPLEDLLSAGVRFAAECLAFANPPNPAGCRAMGGVPGDAAWRAVVPRDLLSTWDFEDVRDHYVKTLFGLDPTLLRRVDPMSWVAHGRAAVALLMEQALGIWRTDGHCSGALVLMLQDRCPGAGWGLVAYDQQPKSAWYALRRACQKLQVVLRDGGMNGVILHAINETAVPREVRLRLRGLTPDGRVEELGSAELTLPSRGGIAMSAVDLMGRWRDLAHAWQFSPAVFVVLGATLTGAETDELLSESTSFPTGPALPHADVGLQVEVVSHGGQWRLAITARGFAEFVQVDDEFFTAEDDHFHLWPGVTRVVALTRGFPGRVPELKPDLLPYGTVTALNSFAVAHYRAVA